MKGNFQVRFLGEGVAAMPLPYPTFLSSELCARQLNRHTGLKPVLPPKMAPQG